MSSLRFEWDEKKNAANRRKRGVSFEEARTPFLHENARVIPDPEHSSDEERFVLIGLSISVRVLVVCDCYRQSAEVIRIISARKADCDETEQYHWWIKEYLKNPSQFASGIQDYPMLTGLHTKG